jgi:uncharacterized protein
MTREVAKSSIEKIVRRCANSKTTFIWHGGEPMLMGLDFYRYVMEITAELRKEGFEIENSIQTNGTLITDEWARFFKENDFHVGISLDGPQLITDKTRMLANGKGAFNRIAEGAEVLRRNGVKFGYLGVVTKHSVEAMDELIDFCAAQERGVKLNPIECIGRASENDALVMGDEFFEVMKKVFEKWLAEGGKNFEKTLYRFLMPLLTGRPSECIFHKTCQDSFIGVDFNGDTYPCGRFCGMPDFKYGNLLENSWEEIATHPQRQALLKRNEVLEEGCQKCRYKEICNGGCAQTAILNNDIRLKDPNCREYYRIFSYIEERIKQESGIV